MFTLNSTYVPTGDQPQAIEKLSLGVEKGLKNQVLVGVTGSGKTFTMANVIAKLNRPALIISHNKTLAGQLYQEFREFFPDNAVSYFVSYYDFYQPEAYIPSSDTYIEKESQINELIDKLRLQATANIMTRRDVIVVASVSCIYNIGSPLEYGRYILPFKLGAPLKLSDATQQLVRLHYERNDFEFGRGRFRIRGGALDIYPAYEDTCYRVEMGSGTVERISVFNPVSGALDPEPRKGLVIYPAKHYMMDRKVFEKAEGVIRRDLKREHEALLKSGKLLEAQRLLQKVNYDLEIIKEVGYVSGIENYSRYFDGRKPGDPPFSMIDYFREAYGNDYMVFIDESHMTIPQLRGMYNGDHARKKTLIDFGFRLEAAFDNRPLRFDEFYRPIPHLIYVSATPDEWEIRQSQDEAEKAGHKVHSGTVEQLIRPTGILDPEVEVRPSQGEVRDLIAEIEKRVAKKEKVLVTTLTKKTAEDLSEYLKEKDMRAAYLHSDVDTLERSDILDNLRKGEFDVLIGVNLLREGLDLPEVTLVAILDADKEGFLRSRTSLVQTMGRAARNILGKVILYADKITPSMKFAMDEIARRRTVQEQYNRTHGISPKTVIKPIRPKIVERPDQPLTGLEAVAAGVNRTVLQAIDPDALTPFDKKRMIKKLEKEMRIAAGDLQFELAIQIRDKIRQLQKDN